jgi:hypothetical protein
MMNSSPLKKYVLAYGFCLTLYCSSIGMAQEIASCTVERPATIQKHTQVTKRKARIFAEKRFIRHKPSFNASQLSSSLSTMRLLMSTGDVAVLNSSGQVKSATKDDGSSNLMDGDRILTGHQSFATLQTKDDTFLTLASNTDVLLSNIKQAPIKLELAQGSVESLVTKQKPTERKSNYQIKTPAVTLSVRGTRFKVAHLLSTGNTQVSVEDGLVAAQHRQVCAEPVMLSVGDGAIASATGIRVKPMLSEPTQIAISPVVKEKTLKVSVAPMPNAMLYHGQASLDESAMLVVKEVYSTSPELEFQGLDNGYYFIRLSAIDTNGVEGFSDIRTVLYQPPPNSDLWLEDFLKP